MNNPNRHHITIVEDGTEIVDFDSANPIEDLCAWVNRHHPQHDETGVLVDVADWCGDPTRPVADRFDLIRANLAEFGNYQAQQWDLYLHTHPVSPDDQLWVAADHHVVVRAGTNAAMAAWLRGRIHAEHGITPPADASVAALAGMLPDITITVLHDNGANLWQPM